MTDPNVYNFDAWRDEADAILLQEYGITFVDAGIEESVLKDYYVDGRTPQEYVAIFTEKYNLEPLSVWRYGF